MISNFANCSFIFRKQFQLQIQILFILFFNIPCALAAVIVDTGPVTDDGGFGTSIFNSRDEFQFMAFHIVIEEETTINSVEVWMKICGSGNFEVKLYSNVSHCLYDSIPGEELQTVSSWVGINSEDHWQSFSGFNWPVKVGTYWVVLEPGEGVNSGLASGALHPLVRYGFLNNMSSEWHSDDSEAYGFRLKNNDGNLLLLPLPAIQLLLFQ